MAQKLASRARNLTRRVQRRQVDETMERAKKTAKKLIKKLPDRILEAAAKGQNSLRVATFSGDGFFASMVRGELADYARKQGLTLEPDHVGYSSEIDISW